MNRIIKKILLFIVIVFSLFSYNDIDLDKNIEVLQEINKDIIGVIYYCNKENIILQSYDNNYYMNHNYLNSISYSGEIFLDYRNNIDDKILIIYGHNSSIYDTGFSVLEKYLNENYYYDNRYIKIRFENKINTYEIISIFVEDNNYSYLNLNINNYLNHYNYLVSKSIYEIDIDLLDEDKILIIQTCSNIKDGSYLVLVSKLIKEDKYDR